MSLITLFDYQQDKIGGHAPANIQNHRLISCQDLATNQDFSLEIHVLTLRQILNDNPARFHEKHEIVVLHNPFDENLDEP